MLDQTVVNVVRRRHLSDAEKRRSAKWQRAVLTVDWLTTRIPATSQFQIYTFASCASWSPTAEPASTTPSRHSNR